MNTHTRLANFNGGPKVAQQQQREADESVLSVSHKQIN